MWFLIWLKFMLFTTVGFAALGACAVLLLRLGQWLERKLALRIPGIVVALWLFYSLYFSVVWTCIEISNAPMSPVP
jgi:putative effector of murein hydrolase LrgA (UPF0299 family)